MWGGFSNGERLCCSLFAPTAHSSPQNLLTCHLIYQEHDGVKIAFLAALKTLNLERSTPDMIAMSIHTSCTSDLARSISWSRTILTMG